MEPTSGSGASTGETSGAATGTDTADGPTETGTTDGGTTVELVPVDPEGVDAARVYPESLRVLLDDATAGTVRRTLDSLYPSIAGNHAPVVADFDRLGLRADDSERTRHYTVHGADGFYWERDVTVQPVESAPDPTFRLSDLPASIQRFLKKAVATDGFGSYEPQTTIGSWLRAEGFGSTVEFVGEDRTYRIERLYRTDGYYPASTVWYAVDLRRTDQQDGPVVDLDPFGAATRRLLGTAFADPNGESAAYPIFRTTVDGPVRGELAALADSETPIVTHNGVFAVSV